MEGASSHESNGWSILHPTPPFPPPPHPTLPLSAPRVPGFGLNGSWGICGLGFSGSWNIKF